MRVSMRVLCPLASLFACIYHPQLELKLLSELVMEILTFSSLTRIEGPNSFLLFVRLIVHLSNETCSSAAAQGA